MSQLTFATVRAPTPVADPKGAVYTPDSLALAIARHVAPLVPVEDGHALRVIDPECGGGAFLRAARTVWPGCLTTGVDVDPTAAGLALADEGIVGDWPDLAEGMWDLGLQNPPFGQAVGMGVTIAHVRAAITRCHVLATILPAPYVTGNEFDEIIRVYPCAKVLRVVDRPWPKVLREVLVYVWRWSPDFGRDDSFRVETLDWRRT